MDITAVVSQLHSHWQHDGWTSLWTYPFFMISFLVTHKYKWKQGINIVMYDSYTHLRAAAHKWDLWLIDYLKYCLLASIMLSCQLRAANYVTKTASRTSSRETQNDEIRGFICPWTYRCSSRNQKSQQSELFSVRTLCSCNCTNVIISVPGHQRSQKSLVLFRPTNQKCYPTNQQEQWWKRGNICCFVCSNAKSYLSIA